MKAYVYVSDKNLKELFFKINSHIDGGFQIHGSIGMNYDDTEEGEYFQAMYKELTHPNHGATDFFSKYLDNGSKPGEKKKAAIRIIEKVILEGYKVEELIEEANDVKIKALIKTKLPDDTAALRSYIWSANNLKRGATEEQKTLLNDFIKKIRDKIDKNKKG